MLVAIRNNEYFVRNNDEDDEIKVDSVPDDIFTKAHLYTYENGEFIFHTDLETRITRENEIYDRLNQLKLKLANTDYVVIKIAEGVATADEYANVIGFRRDWREEINILENELGDLINE